MRELDENLCAPASSSGFMQPVGIGHQSTMNWHSPRMDWRLEHIVQVKTFFATIRGTLLAHGRCAVPR